MKAHHLLPAVALVLALSSLAAADAPAGFTMSLFDGKSLNGWVVTGCEAAVEDGAIRIKSGNGLLRAPHQYGDFILDLEWKALKDDNWDSGIYFRCGLPQGKRPWPEKYQVNLRKGLEGNVDGMTGATSKGLTKPGEWNRFRLTVIGTTAALEINGQPAWQGDGLATPYGYLALQAEVPGGGEFLFRNIQITELGYKSLFGGKDLTGWEPADGKPSDCWKVQDGLLACTGKKGTWLRSTEKVGDFNLRLEYRLTPGGNSGVYVRVPQAGSHHGESAGVEIQVLDDQHPSYANLKPYQFTGSVYAIVAASKRNARPAPEWNQMEIDCRGTRYRVTVNGETVVDADAEKYPELKQRLVEGSLGLQNHNTEVYYRNLRLAPSQP